MFTMMQACREIGMSYETLKFYCNEGLVPNVKRDANNRRIFSQRDVNWLKSLTCLKNCGMSLTEMKTYLALCLQGAASIPARKVMLAKKQEELQRRIQALQEYSAYIDWKQQHYDDMLSGKQPYVSNLLPPEEDQPAADSLTTIDKEDISR